MKKLLTFLALFILKVGDSFGADLYKLDPLHTNLVWSASHFGFSAPSGKFTDIDGKIIIDERNAQNSTVEVIIRTNSIKTGFDKFDTHLKSSDFLDCEKFPIAVFKSTSVRPSGSGFAKVNGTLTIKEIAQPITLDVKINKIGKNPITQKKTIGMTISGTLKRSLYNIKYGIPGISDEVKIEIECEATYEGEYQGKSQDSIAPWQIISEKSKIDFSTYQNGSLVSGSFKKFKGNIIFDPNKLDKSSVEIEVDTTSIDLGFVEAIETLKNSAWLATDSYPKAIFKSEKFVALPGKNNFSTKGSLQLKGKNIPIEIIFNLKAINQTYAHALGTLSIKRTDFNIGDKNINKANGVAELVNVSFEIHAKK